MNNRNVFIDFLKYFAAVGIIFVHSKFPGVAGSVISTVFGSGVCFFFLVSGYSCYGKKDEMIDKIWKRFKRNGLILLFTAAAYFVFAFLMRYFNNIGFEGFIAKLRNPKTYLMIAVFGDFDFIFGIPLWFMVDLLYCYLIFILIVKLDLKKTLVIAIVPLLILKICIEIYVKSMPELSWHWGNSALLGALPFMLLGYLIACYKDKIRLSNLSLLIFTAVSLVLICLTVIFRIGGFVFAEPFCILLATSVFLFSVNNPDVNCNERIAKLGKEDSLYIYLFHYMIALFITFYVNRIFGNTMLIRCILPVFNTVIVIILARLIALTVKSITARKSIKQ